MGNQLVGAAPAQIFPVEHYMSDITDLDFDASLGSTRFLKAARYVRIIITNYNLFFKFLSPTFYGRLMNFCQIEKKMEEIQNQIAICRRYDKKERKNEKK